jgi:hypothetical protein
MPFSSSSRTVRYTGFLDASWQVVVDPVYTDYETCPGRDGDVVLALRGETVDAFDVTGTKTGSATTSGIRCGPLPGYVTLTSEDRTYDVVRLPDLAGSDVPLGTALDAHTVYVYADARCWSEPCESLRAEHLYDERTGETITLPADLSHVDFTPKHSVPLASGEWPVPAVDTQGRYRYLDSDGTWVGEQTFTEAGAFVAGRGWVSDGTSSHFVDTNLDQVGASYTSIRPVYGSFVTEAAGWPASQVFTDIIGYVVESAAGGDNTGLLTPDLTVLVDPDIETVDASYPYHPEHIATAADGTTRLVVLGEGTQTPLPEGFVTVLSTSLVVRNEVDRASGRYGWARVHNLTTGQTFDVPAPFAAVSGVGTFVNCESDNGLRLRMVLDGTGAPTGLARVERMVTAADGTPYFWAVTGTQQGYVDATGAWMYSEPRHTVMED